MGGSGRPPCPPTLHGPAEPGRSASAIADGPTRRSHPPGGARGGARQAARALRGTRGVGPVDPLLGEVAGEARTLGNGQRQIVVLTVPDDGDLHALPGPETADAAHVLLMVADGVAVDGGEHISAQQVLLALQDDRDA